MIPMEYFLVLAAILFVIGAYGVLTKSNAIVVLMCIELMLNAANINFISFAYFTAQDSTAGALFSIFVIAVTACEMAIALAIIVTMYRRHKSLDVDQLRDLHD